ncbi:uncharacterized protein EHS24_005863 [Apiotrichum porosum]|uniref:Peptidyl-prolyl cis-trans isomerase n=1 Tax=Apiotrichum porosum TaxID=105984 RepID=A0A427XZV4_9TREE|nr:uncharacterized protein EHS24_005863 [Apiotrichum porosum]RSH84343.1 hypothetical protein EHS24_005863 [Apiotrichum porosum]
MSWATWEIRFSNSRRLPYFYDALAKESLWEMPAGMTDAVARTLPGAHYLPPNTGTVRPPGHIRASHILSKHANSRRTSSWRQDKITRPAPEARAAIQSHIDRLKNLPANQLAAEFAQIASTESDCSSARKGGDLGWFGKGQMQRTFEEAAYALQPGELSPLVETDSGIHVILRTG